MNWLRLRLIFSNGHMVAVIASFAALVALPTVLQLQPSDGAAVIIFRGLSLERTVAEITAFQMFAVLFATSTYLLGSILTSMTIPIAVASHGNVSEFVKQKYEAISAAKGAGEAVDKLPSMSPGDHWREDLSWRVCQEFRVGAGVRRV